EEAEDHRVLRRRHSGSAMTLYPGIGRAASGMLDGGVTRVARRVRPKAFMATTTKLRTIDGARGEGGGQVLRTALAAALITAEPIRIEKIRAGRAKPGLMRQHLTAVRAAAAISSAEVDGDAVGSQQLTFRPGKVVAGE